MTPDTLTELDKLAEGIMHRMGFPDDANGPYVTELRASIRKQVAAGLRSRSFGTWSHEADMSHEARAKAHLAADWSRERGYSYRCECFDPPIRRCYNFRTGATSTEIHWRRIPAWIGDRYRETGMRWRMFRDRVLRVRNPYGDA